MPSTDRTAINVRISTEQRFKALAADCGVSISELLEWLSYATAREAWRGARRALRVREYGESARVQMRRKDERDLTALVETLQREQNPALANEMRVRMLRAALPAEVARRLPPPAPGE